MCPASDVEWDAYNYQRRVATYAGARAEVIRALEALTRALEAVAGPDATPPCRVDHIIALLPEHPKRKRVSK